MIRKKILTKSKRGQTDVIATLLIVLLVIVAGALLLRYLVPLISDMLSKSDCYQFNGKVEIKNDPTYTCYDPSLNLTYLKVGFGDLDENSKHKITGLAFVVQSDINSVAYQLIPPDSNPPGLSLLNGNIGELPLKNQERTYKISYVGFIPKSVVVYPLIDKKRKCTDSGTKMDFIPNCDILTGGFMSLSSNTGAFVSGGVIPTGYSANDLNVSKIPAGTTKLAVIVEDVNQNGEHHGVFYNIDPPAGSPSSIVLNLGSPGGTGVEGNYVAPNTIGDYYTFTVYALNNPISPATTDKQGVKNAINSTNLLAKATLYGKVTL